MYDVSDLILKAAQSAKLNLSTNSEKKLVELIEAEVVARSAVDEELSAKINTKADKSHTHKFSDIVVLLEDGTTVDSTLQEQLGMLSDNIGYLHTNKADKPTIEVSEDTSYIFEFSNTHNTEKRLAEVSNISFTFGDGEYELDYTSGLSFNSGATPTAIDYTDSGILNWVGTDCTMSNGLSIFQPSANTHYDIVFYFNGTQFIGLVNGFVPATGNEAA